MSRATNAWVVATSIWAVALGCHHAAEEEAAPSAESPQAATPEAVVAQFAEACRANNLAAIVALCASPFDKVAGEAIDSGAKLAEAHRRLEAALDERFGKPTNAETPPFDSPVIGAVLDQLVSANLTAIEAIEVERKTGTGDRLTLTVELRQRGPNGARSRTAEWLALRQGGQWKLVPADAEAQSVESLGRTRREQISGLNNIVDAYAAALRELKEDKYKSRQQVDRVMVRAYEDALVAIRKANDDRAAKLAAAKPPPPGGQEILRMRVLLRADDPATVLCRIDGETVESGTLLETQLKTLNLTSDMVARVKIESGVAPDRSLEVLAALLDAGCEHIEIDTSEEDRQLLEGRFEGRLRLLKRRAASE